MSELRFRFEGREVPARDGQTVAGALWGAGIRTLSWSSKFRRPRGLRCGAGACPGCTVRVNGLAGINACETPIRGGEVVERVRPRLRWLPADRLGFLVPAGFQGARWLRSKAVWDVAERVIAHLAGHGGLADPDALDRQPVPVAAHVTVDLLVVGAGARGLTAATAAGAAGRSVLLIERGPMPGGRLLDAFAGAPEAEAMAAAARAAGVDVRCGATSLGAFDDGIVAIAHAGGLLLVHAREVVNATGSLDREVVLPDGDRPGVLLATAATRLVVREGVLPGRRIVLVQTPAGAEVARGLQGLLAASGVAVVAIVAPSDVRAIRGREHVRAVTLAGGRRIACDAVVVAAGRRPADELARQAHLPIEPAAG